MANQFNQIVSQPTTAPQFQHYQTSSSNPPADSSDGVDKIASSGAAGFAAGGPFGAILGAFGQVGLDALADQRNRRNQEQAQKHADEQSNNAFASSLASQKAAAKYNSEANQVTRYLEAGLSPGLMYGQMSDSSAQAVAASAAQQVPPLASELNKNPALMQALQLMVQQIATGSQAGLNSAQAENLQSQTAGNNINNSYLKARNIVEIAEAMARIRNLRKQGDLSDAQAYQLYELLQPQKDLMAAQENEASSQAFLNQEKQKTEPTVRDLNRANAGLSRANEELSRANKDLTEFNTRNAKEFYEYGEDLAEKLGLDYRAATSVLEALKKAPSEVIREGAAAFATWYKANEYVATGNSALMIGKLNKFIESIFEKFLPNFKAPAPKPPNVKYDVSLGGGYDIFLPYEDSNLWNLEEDEEEEDLVDHDDLQKFYNDYIIGGNRLDALWDDVVQYQKDHPDLDDQYCWDMVLSRWYYKYRKK